jgi:HAD superfamily hydrolase (TIGR01509 family)
MKTILVDAIDGFIIKTSDGFQYFKEMHDLLETFPNHKIIVTSADESKFPEYKLDAAPYEVFTLRHTPEKTDPQYFEILLKHFGLDRHEVIYFEHNPAAVKSAESIGINAYHYDSNKKDLGMLKQFLTNNI